MNRFVTFALSPAGYRTAALAIGACRAGGVGIINGELETDGAQLARELEAVSRKVKSAYGIKID